MHRPPLPGSLQRRAGTARRGLSPSHRNHSRDPASNRTSHPCCAPDVLADGDTSPPDPFDASGRGNSSLAREGVGVQRSRIDVLRRFQRPLEGVSTGRWPSPQSDHTAFRYLTHRRTKSRHHRVSLTFWPLCLFITEHQHRRMAMQPSGITAQDKETCTSALVYDRGPVGAVVDSEPPGVLFNPRFHHRQRVPA